MPAGDVLLEGLLELVLYFAASKGGVSGGGIAGIVVGAVVALLTIAFALFFFLHKKKSTNVRCAACSSLPFMKLKACKLEHI